MNSKRQFSTEKMIYFTQINENAMTIKCVQDLLSNKCPVGHSRCSSLLGMGQRHSPLPTPQHPPHRMSHTQTGPAEREADPMAAIRAREFGCACQGRGSYPWNVVVMADAPVHVHGDEPRNEPRPPAGLQARRPHKGPWVCSSLLNEAKGSQQLPSPTHTHTL